MVFSSPTFIFLYLPIVLCLYYLAPKNFKNPILTLSGLVFFAWGEPIFVLLLMFTICLDYACGLGISKYKENKKMKRLFFAIKCNNQSILISCF
ncbi:MAG: hypothetical protein RR549_07115 [Oscillospiraceae bacterium]